MSKIDMLSIFKDSGSYGDFYISSTNISEVKFFGQMIIEKFKEKESHFRDILYSENGYSLTYKVYSNTFYEFLGPKPESKKIYNKDFYWWLYRIALERGWTPFGKLGAFTKGKEENN